MPPEQGQGLLDVVDDGLGFSAHLFLGSRNSGWAARVMTRRLLLAIVSL